MAHCCQLRCCRLLCLHQGALVALPPNTHASSCAGAPSPSASFFCDASSSSCYTLLPAAATYPGSAASCSALGGALVQYLSAAQQLEVEHYFGAQGVLSAPYWQGVRRLQADTPYALSNTSVSLLQAASNAPYAHWTWGFTAARQTAGLDCVMADPAAAYDVYQGDASLRQQTNASYYLATSPRTKFGWAPALCGRPLQAICQTPAASYPCQPPQAPAMPPDMPAMPSAQPVPGGGCTPADNATVTCLSDACYVYRLKGATFPMARKACLALGGDLVKPDSSAKQLLLERYFASTGVLATSYYWLGISRSSYSSPYRFVLDGAPLPQVGRGLGPRQALHPDTIATDQLHADPNAACTHRRAPARRPTRTGPGTSPSPTLTPTT